MVPLKKRSILPVLGSLNQVRSQGISFDVATEHLAVSIVLNRKAFETGLVDVILAASMIVPVISKRMGRRHPAK